MPAAAPSAAEHPANATAGAQGWLCTPRCHGHWPPRCPPLPHLDLGQYGHNRDDEAEDEVDADEDLALCATLGLGVVDVEQHYGRNGGGIEDEGEDAKSWGRKQKGTRLEQSPSLHELSVTQSQDELPHP